MDIISQLEVKFNDISARNVIIISTKDFRTIDQNKVIITIDQNKI